MLFHAYADKDGDWQLYERIHCSNCGNIVCGYKNSDGAVKLKCSTCGANMVLKQMGRRHDCVDI